MLFRSGCNSVADLTHREARTWLKWLDLQWDHPSRSDYYTMQNTLYISSVAGMFSKNAPKTTMKDLQLNFFDREEDTQLTEEKLKQQAAKNKAAALSMFKNIEIVKK